MLQLCLRLVELLVLLVQSARHLASAVDEVVVVEAGGLGGVGRVAGGAAGHLGSDDGRRGRVVRGLWPLVEGEPDLEPGDGVCRGWRLEPLDRRLLVVVRVVAHLGRGRVRARVRGRRG